MSGAGGQNHPTKYLLNQPSVGQAGAKSERNAKKPLECI